MAYRLTIIGECDIVYRVEIVFDQNTFRKDQRIGLAVDIDQIKILLSFLDEEAYQCPFSKDTFWTTSKRKVAKSRMRISNEL